MVIYSLNCTDPACIDYPIMHRQIIQNGLLGVVSFFMKLKVPVKTVTFILIGKVLEEIQHILEIWISMFVLSFLPSALIFWLLKVSTAIQI